MFVLMFLAVVIELIASIGTLGALVAQNLYTNGASGWYVRLDWTTVYSYAVTIFSVLISFSLTLGALVRNASGEKRTCAAWFNPFTIFLLSFILSVLWTVIAGFAYRNPLPIRYPCDIFHHLKGSLEMLGLSSGKSVVEEGSLLVGICQSSKAFLILTGVGLAMWILILVFSCVSVGTGLEPPKKKAPESDKSSRSSRSLRTLISAISGRKTNQYHQPSNDVYEEVQVVTDNVHCVPTYPPVAATHNPHTAYQMHSVPRSPTGRLCRQVTPPTVCQTCQCNVRNNGCQQCAHACAAHKEARPTRIYTHSRHRHSGINNMPNPSIHTPPQPREVSRQPKPTTSKQPRATATLANPADAFMTDGYSQDISSRAPSSHNNPMSKTHRVYQREMVHQQIEDDGDASNEDESQHGDYGHAGHQTAIVNTRMDHVNDTHYVNEYNNEGYVEHHISLHGHHSPNSQPANDLSTSPHSQNSRRQRLRQLFVRDAEPHE